MIYENQSSLTAASPSPPFSPPSSLLPLLHALLLALLPLLPEPELDRGLREGGGYLLKEGLKVVT